MNNDQNTAPSQKTISVGSGVINVSDPVYIAGPMTGIPEFNYPEFHEAERLLGLAGFSSIYNPANIAGGNTSLEYNYYLREGFKMLLECKTMVLLPGWKDSRGAKYELALANMLGITVVEFTRTTCSYSGYSFTPLGKDIAPDVPKETICQEADRIVSEDRMNQYGHPADDFKRIATIWGVILGKEDIRPEQVAMCMIGTKLSRMCHDISRDSLTDTCGYAKTISMIKNI